MTQEKMQKINEQNALIKRHQHRLEFTMKEFKEM